MNTNHLSNRASITQKSNRGSSQFSTLVIVALVVLAAVATYFLRREKASPAKIDVPTMTNAPLETAPATAPVKSDLQIVKGRWARVDGNYVLEIRTVGADGQLEAGYYNPQPIHVSKAEVKKDGAATKVFIELNDVNYPGCKYNLTYIPNDDRFAGTYYQAALQETYDVMFERLKE